MVKKGTWVNIQATILEPKDRAEGIPEETAKTPLIMWVCGFLDADANVGDKVTITTRSGRKESGVLDEVEPTSTVTYGDFIPEILDIGTKARAILFGGDA